MRRTLFVGLVLLMIVGVMSAAAAAPAPKLDVCHYDADLDAYHLINISENAFDKHVEHGDYSPGDGFPGLDFYTFGEDCEPVLTPELVATGTHTGVNPYPGLTVDFMLYEGPAGTYSGTGAYTFNGNAYDLTITDACFYSGNVTVRGTTSAEVGFANVGYGMLSLNADGTGARAGVKATAAEIDPFYSQQCSGSAAFPSHGTGSLTLP